MTAALEPLDPGSDGPAPANALLDARITEAIEALDLAAGFVAEGRSWVELDENDEVIYRHPDGTSGRSLEGAWLMSILGEVSSVRRGRLLIHASDPERPGEEIEIEIALDQIAPEHRAALSVVHAAVDVSVLVEGGGRRLLVEPATREVRLARCWVRSEHSPMVRCVRLPKHEGEHRDVYGSRWADRTNRLG